MFLSFCQVYFHYFPNYSSRNFSETYETILIRLRHFPVSNPNRSSTFFIGKSFITVQDHIGFQNHKKTKRPPEGGLCK